ncbi:hypothetical protein Tco_1495442, partial [Tanacetum coccineum]
AEIFSHLRLKLVSLTVKRSAQVEEISFLNMNFGVALQFGRLREPLMGLLGTSIALLRRKCSHEAKVGELVNMNDSVDA